MSENEKSLAVKQLPTATTMKLLADLVEGLITHEAMAAKYHISTDTVTRYSKLYAETIGTVKRKIEAEVLASSEIRIAKHAKKLLDFAEDCLTEAGLKKKIKKMNTVQLMTAMAIAHDKRQLITGGATERFERKITTKAELLSELNGDANMANSKSLKIIEKSISFESANNNGQNEILTNKIELTETAIKKALKNEGLL